MKYMCNLCHYIASENEYEETNFYCPKCGIDKEHFVRYVEIEETNKKVFVSNENPSINRIIEKCINCGLCTKTCNNLTGLNLEKDVHECVNCGNCILMCPTGALCPKYDYRKVMNIINEKEKVVVAFIAPAVKASINECFDMEYDKNSHKKLIAALRDIGFNYVLDTSFGADVTTSLESKELIDRVKNNKNLPMFTSCCPAWVKYVEGKYPEFISNLSTVKSPNAIMGALVKSYFSQENHIPKEKIVTVGIVPCTAKKFESNRKELMNDGFKNVDYYLTTTEVSMMIKENKIDFKNIRLSEFDKLMGKASSSGVIFGSTGGVTESVLRAVSYLNGKSEDKNTCEVIRDTKDFKEVSVSIGSMKLNVLVVYGLKNAKEVLDKIKNKTVKCDFVEVMSCPMGCVGGAGNKLSNINKLDEVRDMRKDLLNLFDSEMIVRNCFQNKEMMKLFNGYLNKERIKNYLHTSFSKKSLTK